MKSRWTTCLLLAAVAAVWGVVAWRTRAGTTRRAGCPTRDRRSGGTADRRRDLAAVLTNNGNLTPGPIGGGIGNIWKTDRAPRHLLLAVA